MKNQTYILGHQLGVARLALLQLVDRYFTRAELRLQVVDVLPDLFFADEGGRQRDPSGQKR